MKPTDSNGRICGEFYSGAEGDLRTKKYLYFFDITKCSATHINCAATPQVCVESCPTSTVAYGFGMTPEESICKYGFNATDNSLLGTYVSNGTCAPYLLASSSFFKRCVPTTSALSSTIVYDDNGLNITIASVNLTSAMYTLLNYFNAAEVSQQILADLDNSWYYLIAGCAVSLGLSYLYLIFLRFYSGCMVWSSIIISLVASIAATAYSFQLYKDRKSINDALPYQLHFNSYKYQEYTFLALAIVCAVIVVILLILILFLRTRIKIAIEIIREASKALVSMPLIVFFPFVTMGLVIALLMYWVWVGAFLTSSSTANYLDNNNTACTPPSDPLTPTNCSFYDYTTTQNLVNIQIYHLVGLLWTLNLISALGDCTIAGAIASWYWTRDHKGMPWFPIASAFKRTIIYHLGSLAFGSLIIAIVQLIRIGLEYIDRQTKNTQSQFMKFIIKCLKCCFWCLEKFIKFINTNAYIEIAVYGYSFCTAARKAFELLTRNIIR